LSVSQITLGEIAVDVVLKDIKNVHLSVYPPTGRVRISAPERMSLDTIRSFVISKLGWIRQQQTKLRAQERETPREYTDRESHYVWGRRYLLTVVESDERLGIELKHSRLLLRIRPGTDLAKRKAVVEGWYREQLRAAVPPLLTRWTPRIGVRLERFYVQRMRTRWGSCNPKARTIRLNTELAKKPVACLEYVVVHELVHLLEPTHTPRFIALMDQFIPAWDLHRQGLNRLPIGHTDWTY
jgi:predicted metal-dependent hydrolase